MSDFDVRKKEADIDRIVFSASERNNTNLGFYISPFFGEGIKIGDVGCFVVVRTAADADNLRKALDKAEELGWLK